MTSLERKIPPPLVALIFGVIMWWLSAALQTIPLGTVVRLGASAALLFIGLLFCLSGVISFKRVKTTVNPLKPELATSLVCSGIYKVSRNPMYVGFALMLGAWAVFLASPWSFLGVFGFILYLTRFQIVPEERALIELFGDDFDNYKSRVRRWL